MLLRLADTLEVPVELVTQTTGILAKRGVGKTYTALVMAEELLGAGAQIVVLDPLDGWWGLRLGADGTPEGGLPVYVFGGEHGDLPLEAEAGALLADVVVDHGISAVLSLRHLSKTQQRRFVADFCERLYHRKGEPAHRTPLHVFIDEADAFAPQRVVGDVARAMGAVDDLVRRGRSSGIGVTLITQRAAAINKDVLTQIEVLIALRTVSPQDRKALEAWIEAHDAHDQHAEFMGSLASLGIGEAWFWSPGWLDIFQRVQVRRRRTFDSSSTPAAGAAPLEATQLAPVDIEALGERIAASREEAAAKDPKRLRARIAELERQLDTHVCAVEPCDHEEDELRLERLEATQRALEMGFEALRERARTHVSNTELAFYDIGVITERLLEGARAVLAAIEEPAVLEAEAVISRAGESRRSAPQASAPARTSGARPPDVRAGSTPAPGLTPYMRDLLAAAGMRHPAQSTRAQLSLLSGRSHRSSAFGPALRACLDQGYLEERGDGYLLTLDGLAEVGDALPPTGVDAPAWWRSRLSGGELAFFDALLEAWPNSLSREQLAERTGRSLTSSSFRPALRDLMDRGLAEVNEIGRFRLVDDLMGRGSP